MSQWLQAPEDVCSHCLDQHHPEFEGCPEGTSMFENFKKEMFTIKAKHNENYYICKLLDGSEIYCWNEEFACSHCSKPNDELGDACDSCSKIMFSVILPLEDELWRIYHNVKVQERHYSQGVDEK